MRPKKRLFQKTKLLYIAMILALFAVILVGKGSAITFLQDTLVTTYNSTAEPGSAIALHLDKCSSLNVNVTATLPIQQGDYSLNSFAGCTLIGADYWFCECWDGFDLQISTTTANNYTLTANYTYVYYDNSSSSGGSSLDCQTPWSDCENGVWHRLCYSSGTPVTIYEECSNTTSCTENWQCASWGNCQPSNTKTRTCTDTNNCGTALFKPDVLESCTYSTTGQNCTESWQCTDWTNCLSTNYQSRICIDANNCGTTATEPSLTQNCTFSGGGNQSCTENWQCTSWGVCQSSNIQIRSCTDANNCGTATTMPSLSQSCTYGGGGNQNCTENWQCTSWGNCQPSNTKTRTCTDTNNCNTTATKPTLSQSCTYSSGGNSGGGGGGGGGSSGSGGSTSGWICTNWSDCIASKRTQFCHSPDSMALNYTVSEKCVENKIPAPTIPKTVLPVANNTKPVTPAPLNQTVNQTQPQVKSNGISGNLVADAMKGGLLFLILLLVILILYLLRNRINALFAGKKKGGARKRK